MNIAARNVKQLSTITSLVEKFRQLINYKTTRVVTIMDDEMVKCFPFFAKGVVVEGFKRGSKELGIPTANYPLEVVKSLPEALNTGIYYGWANVDNGEVFKMVMSIGLNPFYNNKEKSMETHILHEFDRDFYGQYLKVCIVGFLRHEQNFKSLDELIAAIKGDIENTKQLLENNKESQLLKTHKFFNEPISEGQQKQTVQLNGDKKLENGS